MQALKLKIAQVSRVMGGRIVVEGPPQPGQEVFMREINNNGAKSWNLLVGVYKVLFEIEEGALDGEGDWFLDQVNLMNLGCTLTLHLYPLQGILQVHNDILVVEHGAVCATLIKQHHPMPDALLQKPD